MIRNALTIAGSDPSGGAGIQADLKTFSALRVYGAAAITALTAQSTRGVTGVHPAPADFVEQQIDTLRADVRIDAVKIGMLANAGIASAVAAALERWRPDHVVLDPVMVAKSGDRLLDDDAMAVLRERLVPAATVITPNLPEAGVLLEAPAPAEAGEMAEACRALSRAGARAVLLKGGHLGGAGSPDLLLADDEPIELPGPRHDTPHTHGTGCTLSSALAAGLARGAGIAEAARAAKDYTSRAIAHAHELSVGSGHGPTHHFHELWE